MISKFSKTLARSARIPMRFAYYSLASFSKYQDPQQQKQKFDSPQNQPGSKSQFDKLEERAQNPDYMELIGFDRPAEIDPEAPGILIQEYEAKLPPEFRMILHKYPTEIDRYITSRGEARIPAQLVKDVMEEFSKLSETQSDKLFPKLISQARNPNLDAKGLIKLMKDFLGYNWWYHGEISHMLKGMGFNPSIWEKNIGVINQEDKTFLDAYATFQKKILEQVFQLEKLSEEKMVEVKNFFDKEFKELSKSSILYEGISAKVDHLLKDKLHVDLGAAAEKVADVAKKVIGRK